MCLIYHNGIYTKFFKGNLFILSLLICQFLYLFFQTFLVCFHLFDGPAFTILPFCFINGKCDLLYLPSYHIFFSLSRYRYLFKL